MATTKVKPSLSGLQNALVPNQTDPLGLGVQQRGMDSYQAAKQQEDPNYLSGPLPDPRWEGLLQALAESGATHVGQDAARPEGIASDPTSTFNTATGPYGRFGVGTDGVTPDPLNPGLMKSTNIATPPRLRYRQKVED